MNQSGESGNYPRDLESLIEELTHASQLADIPRRVELYRDALQLVDPFNQPELWAALQTGLGDSLFRNIRARPENLEQAMKAYHQALEFYTPQDFPEQWASTMIKL